MILIRYQMKKGHIKAKQDIFILIRVFKSFQASHLDLWSVDYIHRPACKKKNE